MDVHSKRTRSFNMSKIRSSHTKPEMRLLEALSSRSVRGYRLHSKLLGRPDFEFRTVRTLVFVDGCFWHGCTTCSDGRRPRSNKIYWNPKLKMNRERDLRNTRRLRRAGWSVIRLWEHEVLRDPQRCAELVARALQRRRSELLRRYKR